MNFLNLFHVLLTALGDIPKAMAALVALNKLVLDAEATGQDGPTKLAKVLNDFEAMLNTVSPMLGTDFESIAGMVETAVNEIVAFYNGFARAGQKAS